MKVQDREIYRDREQLSVCLGLGVRMGVWDWELKGGYRVTSEGDEKALNLSVVMGVRICECTENQCIAHFKGVNRMIRPYISKGAVLKRLHFILGLGHTAE